MKRTLLCTLLMFTSVLVLGASEHNRSIPVSPEATCDCPPNCFTDLRGICWCPAGSNN